jgi:hypothetical protein
LRLVTADDVRQPETGWTGSDANPGPVTLRGPAIILAVVIVGLWCLPAPLTLVNAVLAPALFIVARRWPRLRRPLSQSLILVLIPVLFVPALTTHDPSDWNMAVTASILSLPPIVRLLTFWGRSDTWDLLDPLVVICMPFTSFFLFVILVRMFEMGLLIWK